MSPNRRGPFPVTNETLFRIRESIHKVRCVHIIIRGTCRLIVIQEKLRFQNSSSCIQQIYSFVHDKNAYFIRFLLYFEDLCVSGVLLFWALKTWKDSLAESHILLFEQKYPPPLIFFFFFFWVLFFFPCFLGKGAQGGRPMSFSLPVLDLEQKFPPPLFLILFLKMKGRVFSFFFNSSPCRALSRPLS